MHSIKQVADELGMSVVSVPHGRRDAVWTFIAQNIDRLRPCGFDGHVVLCAQEHKDEFFNIATQESMPTPVYAV